MPLPRLRHGAWPGSRDPRPILRFILEGLDPQVRPRLCAHERTVAHVRLVSVVAAPDPRLFLVRITPCHSRSASVAGDHALVRCDGGSRCCNSTPIRARPSPGTVSITRGFGMCRNPPSAGRRRIFFVHRISRSEAPRCVIRALAQLPPEYTLTYYGRAARPDGRRGRTSRNSRPWSPSWSLQDRPVSWARCRCRKGDLSAFPGS